MRTICLCGSTRFIEDYRRVNRQLSLFGHVVYSVAMTKEDTQEAMTEEDKLVLDAVHMGKIANSDVVHFLNIGGYLGESSRRELYFAVVMGKLISFEDYRAYPAELVRPVPDYVAIDETGKNLTSVLYCARPVPYVLVRSGAFAFERTV